MFENFNRLPTPEKNNQEDIFYQEVENLPEELATRWTDEYENLADPENSDFFERFHYFLGERKRVTTIVDLEIVPETPPEVVEQILALKEDITNEYENPNSFLGEGRTAKVHIHPKNSDICIKYIKDADSYTKTDIPLYQEFMRLRELQNLKVKGVRTPTPYFESTGGRHIYGMERIKGNTLVQIMQKPSENIELIELARTLDRETALDNIVSFVREMHEKFKITHNDLEIINVMLGFDGNFYVIDFGKSKFEEIGEDHEMYREFDIKMVKSAVQEFFEKIDNIDIDDINKKE